MIAIPGSTPELPDGSQPATNAQFNATSDVTLVLNEATADAMAAVTRFAVDHCLDIVEAAPERRTVRVNGSLPALAAAFATDFELHEHPTLGVFRAHTSAISVPDDVAGHVQAVLGLDDRPVAFPRNAAHAIRPHASGDGSYTPPQVAAAYNFPTDVTGKGATIAIIELGGGYTAADLSSYLRSLGITQTGTVSVVGVDGGRSKSDGPNGADGEVMLDVEVVAAVAPGANIKVYFAPNTDAGFVDALTTALNDPSTTAVSISWGQAEDQWSSQAKTAFDSALADGRKKGIPVFAASGDDGSTDNVNDGKAHADFPASSPNAVGCGGTNLSANGAERVWNNGAGNGAGGGGVSKTFGVPSYQTSIANLPTQANTHKAGRVVPDVSGNADPETGYQIRIDGSLYVIGGTSAVAPLWAALMALMREKLGHSVGDILPALYAAGQLRDVTSGNNGAYSAATGFDACTGLGSPDGAKVLAALSGTVTPPPVDPPPVDPPPVDPPPVNPPSSGPSLLDFLKALVQFIEDFIAKF